jgi:hypothetical protein
MWVSDGLHFVRRWHLTLENGTEFEGGVQDDY